MRAPNPTAIPLHYRDWPRLIDGEPPSLEQNGALILLVFQMWSQQTDLDFEGAKRVLGIRHPAVARRINLSALLEIARELVRRRAPIEKSDRKHVERQSGGSCHYCGKDLPKGFHIDHAIPVSRGGKNDLRNYRAACPECNSAKGTMTEDEFMAWRKGS